MKQYVAACVLVLGAFLGAAGSADPPAGPARDVPELAPLSHYVGHWDTEMTIKPNAAMPKGARATVTAVSEWIHDGRFMRQTWSSQASEGLPAMSGTTIMTYDPRKKAYRSWSFYSSGALGESRGAWDAKARTMTWTMQDAVAGGEAVTKATFPEDGRETWSITEKDRDGKVVSEITGQSKRRRQ